MAYEFASPLDGWAYNQIELEYIWQIPVVIDDVIHTTGRWIDFHSKMQAQGITTVAPGDIDDAKANDFIMRAVESEITNPDPAGIGEDCDIGEGWIHGDPEEYNAT